MVNAPIVKMLRNPYRHLISDADFLSELQAMAARRAEDVLKKHRQGYYRRASLGMCLLDPTLSLSVPSIEAVLALIAIGEEGESYLVNAIAKACEHRDFGLDCGVLAYIQPHRLSTGRFRFGHSACVDGTFVGSSAQLEIHDRYQSIVLGADYNVTVGGLHEDWSATHDGKWLSQDNQPDPGYSKIAALLHT